MASCCVLGAMLQPALPATHRMGACYHAQGLDCTSCFAVTQRGQAYTWGGGGAHAAGLDKSVLVEKFGEEWFRLPVRLDGGLHKAADAEEKWAARMIAASAAQLEDSDEDDTGGNGSKGGKGKKKRRKRLKPRPALGTAFTSSNSEHHNNNGGKAGDAKPGEPAVEETALELKNNIVDLAPGKEHCVAAIEEGSSPCAVCPRDFLCCVGHDSRYPACGCGCRRLLFVGPEHLRTEWTATQAGNLSRRAPCTWLQ